MQPASDRVVPETVEIRQFKPNGKVTELIEVAVTKAEYNVPVDPKLWSLAGLKMPLGEMVIDERISRVVGHFDGRGLTANFNEAVKGNSSRWKPLLWGMAITGPIIAAVLAAGFVHRRNLIRREA